MSNAKRKRCPVCKSLEDQSADVEPPAQVREQVHHFVRDGSVQVYRCGACGAQWERFVPKQAVGVESGAWKVLKTPQ